MTLRDELEAKLRSIYVKADSDVFGLIADEVIRQMRWAESKHSFGHGGPPPYLCETLAPDGWKP